MRARTAELHGDAVQGFRHCFYASEHSTAGFLPQSLAARLIARFGSVSPYLDVFRNVFPEGAGYRHDQLELRDELLPEQKAIEPTNADSHLAFMGGGIRACVVGDANADNVVIEDFEFVDGDAAGTQKQSFIQFAAATGVVLRGIKCTGDFGTGIIENGTAWIDALLEDLVLDNASVTPTVALFLSATSSGWVRKSSLRVASGLVGYTANNDMQFDDVKIVGTDALGAADDVIGSTATTAATGAVTTTDTLMGYIKQIVTMLGPTELDTDTLGEILVGTAGITTFPNAAVPATGVSLAEVIRDIWAVLNGTAAGENGVQVFPAAVAPGNNVSLAEVLRDVWDALRNGTGGAEPGSNRSVMDYLGVTPGFFVPGLGYKITKAANMQVTADDIFDITGAVAITLIYGEVTASLDGTVTTALLRVKTDNVNLCAATTITSDGDGTMYMLSGDFGAIMNGADIPVVRATNLSGVPLAPMIVGNAGVAAVIEQILGAADVATGAVTYTLFYMPLDTTAVVTASA